MTVFWLRPQHGTYAAEIVTNSETELAACREGAGQRRVRYLQMFVPMLSSGQRVHHNQYGTVLDSPVWRYNLPLLCRSSTFNFYFRPCNTNT